jgi:hypothetical protein
MASPIKKKQSWHKDENWGFHLNAAFTRLGLKLAHFFLPTKASS